MIALLLLTSLAALDGGVAPGDAGSSPEQAFDGGAQARDGGSGDGGSRDGGLRDGGFRDAGAPDAGRDAGPVNYWLSDGGDEIRDGGITDVVVLTLGGSTDVSFYKPVTLSVCDQPLVRFEPKGENLRFIALAAGETQCGFWFSRKQQFPERLFVVSVTDPSAPVDAGASPTRPWWAPLRTRE